jgi:hypothetical protein
MDLDSVSLLSDDAVFRRTPLGQRELAWPSTQLTATQRLVLAVVSGCTPLRAVFDQAGCSKGMKESIEGLIRKRLIEPAR